MIKEMSLGFAVGVIFLMVIIKFLPDSKIEKYNSAIEQCEKTLPRNEHCVIVAVPVSKD